MPRYFFNIKKDSHTPDTVGVELPDLASARVEAIKSLALDLGDNPNGFWNDEEWQIAFSNEGGLILFTLYCSAVAASSLKP